MTPETVTIDPPAEANDAPPDRDRMVRTARRQMLLKLAGSNQAQVGRDIGVHESVVSKVMTEQDHPTVSRRTGDMVRDRIRQVIDAAVQAGQIEGPIDDLWPSLPTADDVQDPS